MGYVGLPLALRFSEAGFRVTGFDLDPAKAESIADRQSYFAHITDARISAAVDCGLAVATDMARTAECDAIIICVPTPLGSHQEPAESTSPFRASISCLNTSYSSSFLPKNAVASDAFSATPCGVRTYK